MKQSLISKKAKQSMLRSGILMLTLIVLNEQTLHAQLKKRTYANYEENAATLLASVSNEKNAIDSNLTTASTLEVDLGVLNLITATQDLLFTTSKTKATARIIPANTPVTIKVELPTSIAGVLDNLVIQPYRIGTSPLYLKSNAGGAFSGANLVNLINGAGIAEIIIQPTENFHGISITLGSVVGLGVSMSIYDAYVKIDNAVTIPAYNTRLDVLYGQRGNLDINLASSTATVDDPENAIDDEPTPFTFALMSSGASVLSTSYIRGVFATPSTGGDSVMVYLQDPGAGLLDLSLLAGVTIQPYLGNTPAGGPIVYNSSFLTLRLLTGGTNMYAITAPVGVPFDRIDVSFQGGVTALSNLRVYDISRAAANVVLPVSITDFGAKKRNGLTSLSWRSENETGIDSYEVQRSTDGINYKTIGIVFPADRNIDNYYSFNDNGISTGTLFYRLYIKESDGTTRYSSFATVNHATEIKSQLVIAPNPIQSNIRIQLSGMEEGMHRIEVYNQSGQLQQSKMINIRLDEQVEQLDRNFGMRTGMYWLSIYDKNNKLIKTAKFMAE